MIGDGYPVLAGAFLLAILAGCHVQFQELPETDAVISCREQGFERGSLAFRDCVEGGVEAIKTPPDQKPSP